MLPFILYLAGSQSFAEPIEPYVNSLTCGRNSAIALACIYGIQAPEGKIEAIAISSQGTSLRELVRCLNEMGVPCDAKQYEPGEVRYIPLPAIMRMKFSGTHHFLVVFDKGFGKFNAIDTTTGAIREIPDAKIFKYFAGQAVVLKANIVITKFRTLSYPVRFMLFMGAAIFLIFLVREKGSKFFAVSWQKFSILRW